MSFYSCQDCYNKISCPGCLKQQIFIAHSSSGREVQDQGAGNSLSGEGHLPSLQTAASHLAICIYISPSLRGGREQKLSSVFLIKALTPSWRLHPSWIHLNLFTSHRLHLQRPPHCRLVRQHEFEGPQTLSPQQHEAFQRASSLGPGNLDYICCWWGWYF